MLYWSTLHWNPYQVHDEIWKLVILLMRICFQCTVIIMKKFTQFPNRLICFDCHSASNVQWFWVVKNAWVLLDNIDDAIKSMGIIQCLCTSEHTIECLARWESYGEQYVEFFCTLKSMCLCVVCTLFSFGTSRTSPHWNNKQ